MIESVSWQPLPTGRAPWGRRVAAIMLLVLALGGAAFTVIVWRADAADRRGDYARAVRWRPQVPLYRRHWGESLLLTDPRASERELLASLRLNPYDPLTIADLTTVELALGRWPQAVAAEERERSRRPGFNTYWQLANLYLSHGDLAGYWQELALAAPRADPTFFPSIVSHSLTASRNDFAALRRALPSRSVAAASAYLSAAVAQANRPQSLTGEDWLVSLPVDAAQEPARRQAMIALLDTAFHRWPADAPGVWTKAAAVGALPGPAKQAAPPYLRDGDFSPAQELALRRTIPDPGDPLRALLGWRWSSPAGVRFHPVFTGEPRHPTAAEFIFNGNEADDVALPEQWILARGGKTVLLSVTARRIDPAPEQGISARLTSLQGQVLATIPVPLSGAWHTDEGSFSAPGTEIGAYVVSLHYRRPNGEMPLQGRILVTAVSLR